MTAARRADRRIVLRADASRAHGYGHVARLTALADEIRARGGGVTPLFGDDITGVAWSTDAALEAATAQGVTAVVVDGPQLVAELAPALIARGVPTIVVDDNGSCPHECAAIVNHNPHAAELASTYAQSSQLLLGRRYALLRASVTRYAHGQCRPKPRPRLRVAITFGGSDPPDATSRALRLLPSERSLDVVAIAGPGYAHHAALHAAALVAESRGHAVEICVAPEDPAAWFVVVDTAISAAGGTLGELAYLGCPALAFAIAPDQIAPARYQARHGCVAGGHAWRTLSDAAVTAELRAFLVDDAARAALRERALATIDGSGAARVVDAALALG